MISTKININDIPTNWIFENYCKLNQKLKGQDIKIISVFNINEKTPSFWIYPYNNKYRFWDFSSGLKGTALQFVMIYFNLTEEEAISKIYKDFKGKLLNHKPVIEIYTNYTKSKLISFKTRKWTKLDAQFWLMFKIGKKVLEKYNVKPLSELILSKNDKTFIFKKPLMFGYFKKDGTLYKTYEPYNKKNKFLTFQKYIQGLEQLEYKSKNLIINSSLKDIMSTEFLKLNFEYIAPESENITINKKIMNILIFKYNNIYTLFDNDEAGLKASLKYQKMFNTKPLYLDLSKDISDSLKDYSPKLVKHIINKQI